MCAWVCVYNMHVYVYYLYGYTCVCMHVCTCIYIVCVCSCEFMCLVACYSISDSFVRDPSSVTGNFDYVRYESDTQAI